MIPNISVVIPSYNESENIEILYSRIIKTLKEKKIFNYEIIYIENGSTDNSLKILKMLHEKDNQVKIISFTRNFGLQNAIYAGLNYVKNDYVCVLDGDLQDPPEMIKDFISKINDGYDIVFGIRKKREASLFKRICYKMFYFFFNKFSEVSMPIQVGEFCLMKKKVVDRILEFKEKNLFIRGLRTWVGFNQTGIEYERPARNAGDEKFKFLDSFFLGLDGLISFSLVPLRIILFSGLVVSSAALLFSFFILIVKFLSIINLLSNDLLLMPKGLSTTNILILFFSSLILLSLGIIAEYIAKIYFEVKNRPHYIIKETIL